MYNMLHYPYIVELGNCNVDVMLLLVAGMQLYLSEIR